MSTLSTWKNRLSAALFLGVLAIRVPAADAAPTVSLAFTPDPPSLSAPLSVDIVITDAVDLFAFQYTLSFDPDALQVSAVSEGPFLAGGGATFFDTGTIDNMLGSISFMFNTLIGPVAGVNGSGILARVEFDVLRIGSSTLRFSDALFLSSSFDVLDVQTQDATVQVVPEPGVLPLLLAGGVMGLAFLRRRTSDRTAEDTACLLGG